MPWSALKNLRWHRLHRGNDPRYFDAVHFHDDFPPYALGNDVLHVEYGYDDVQPRDDENVETGVRVDDDDLCDGRCVHAFYRVLQNAFGGALCFHDSQLMK